MKEKEPTYQIGDTVRHYGTGAKDTGATGEVLGFKWSIKDAFWKTKVKFPNRAVPVWCRSINLRRV